MCFSPEASFAGGVIISAIGVATVTKVHKPSQLLFASIPLFFGLQQFAEGTLWMTLPNPDYVAVQKFTTYLFLIMADVLWPVMIPLSVLFMEENKKKKPFLWTLLGLGIALSSYYAFCLLFYNVTPRIMGYHIKYFTDFPKSVALPAFFVYLFVTITPLFISSVKRTRVLGVFMFLSCAVTAIFFTQYLTSVWCFFAALISGVIFWILRDSKRKFIFEKSEVLEKLNKSVESLLKID
jgi:hypothetical protein